MTLTCPRDRSPLRAVDDIHRCPTCHHDYVVSITDAYTTRLGWNRDAPGAGAVLAVLEATGRRA